MMRNSVYFMCVSLVLLGCGSEGLQRNVWNAAADGYTASFEEHERFTYALEQVYEAKSDSLRTSSLTGAIQLPLTMQGERVVCADAAGSVYAADGEIVRWIHSLPKGEAVMSDMMADSAGNTYLLTQQGRMVSLSPSGQVRLDTVLFGGNGLRIYSHVQRLSGGRMLFACSDGRVRCVDSLGRVQWQRNYDLEPMSHIAVKNNRIILPLTSMNTREADSLICLDFEGNTVWSKGFESTQFTSQPLLTEKASCIGGRRTSGDAIVNVVWKFGMMGESNWSVSVDYTPRYLSMADDGTLYVVGRSTGIGAPVTSIVALSSQGKEQWEHLFGAVVVGQPLIAQENLVFSAVTDSTFGLVYMSRAGNVEHKLSLTTHPILRMEPVVDANGNIVLLATEKATHARIGQSALLKILP